MLFIEAAVRVLGGGPSLFQLRRLDIADGARMLEHVCHVPRRIHLLQKLRQQFVQILDYLPYFPDILLAHGACDDLFMELCLCLCDVYIMYFGGRVATTSPSTEHYEAIQR